MKRKYIGIVFSTLLILFSSFYTNEVVDYFRSNDQIMKEILEFHNDFGNTMVESVVKTDDNTIIPGISGKKVDIKKSYSNMKINNKFDKNLIAFMETMPSVSLKNNYDNYIISGNLNRKYVSFVVVLHDTSYIEDFLSIFNSKNINVTFFIDKNIFNNSIDIVKMIKSFGHDIELLSDSYSVYEVNKYNSIVKLISDDKLSYCINDEKNKELLKNCSTSKLYYIIPSITYNKYLYNTVKNNLSNGAIIKITNDLTSIRELSTTINYIKQKGKEIVLLKKLLEE